MKVLDKENRVMVEPLSIRHFQDMEMCFPEWRLHLSEGHQYNGYGKFFFFFFTWSQNLHPVVLKKGAPKQRFLQRKDNNIKVTGTFYFSFGVKICIPLFWTKVLQSRGSFSEKVTGTFFFFIWSQYLCPCFLNAGVPKETYSCSNWPMHYHRGLTYVGWHDEQSIAFTAFRNLSYLNA